MATVIFLVEHKKINRTNINQTNIGGGRSKYLILIPAHNEEKVIGRLLDSIANLDYPRNMITSCVICDNCSDDTEEIATSRGSMIVRRIDETKRGKGYAIEWALSQIDIERFNVIVMTDADTTLDRDILIKLDAEFSPETTQVVQCYNGVINPDDTPLTRLISLARALEIIYMTARSSLGLTVHLIGNGMCFRPEILKQFPWTAFSIAEDFEYFCILALNGIRIQYSYAARVFLQEEKKLSHAKTQRQRWSGGRFSLIVRYAPKIFWSGLKKGSIEQIEAALMLLLPNPSLLGNVLVFTLALALLLTSWLLSKIFIVTAFLFLFLYFTSSFLISGISGKKVMSMLLIPVYLVWKGVIDLGAVLGRKKNQWVKTSRH
jgi:cellulose synthase/poly-beta-1,6-N-acetylglucosamine synthase-like glycosyltransferase